MGSEKQTVLDLLAHGITSFVGVSSICALILLVAIWVFAGFWRRSTPLVQALRDALRKVESTSSEEDFAVNYEGLRGDLRENAVLGHTWREFEETLIPAPDLEPQGIRNARSAGEYFTRQSVLGEKLNLRYYAAFPNLLTGAGILGTFLGLVAGIGLASKGLASSETEVVKAALQDLLSGASLAFMTSITGLVSSMLFSWGEKHQLHKLESGLRRWIDALDARLIRTTTEQLAHEQLTQLRQQTTVLEQFTQDLAFQIGAAVQERMTEKLGPTLDRLVEAVEAMRDREANKDETALREMLTTFSESLSGSAGAELSALGSTLGNLNEKLESHIDRLSTQQQEFGSRLQQEVGNALGTITGQIEALLGRFQEALTQVNDVMDRAGTTSNEYNRLLERTRETLGTVEATVRETAATLQTLTETASNNAASVEASRQIVVEMKSLAERGEQSVGRLAELQDEIKAIWADYGARFEGADKALGKVMEELNTGASRYFDSVRDFVTGLEKNSGDIVRNLAGATRELNESVEGLDGLTGAISELSQTFRQESLTELAGGRARR